MAGNPTAVNIGIGFNVQDIAPTRSQVASFMRDVKASITDVERFAQKVKIGESLLKKGDISQAEFDRTIAMHREKYGIIDQGEKRVAEYHAHKQAMAKREEDSMLFLMRLRQEGRKMDDEAHAKKMADIAAEKKAEEDSMIFLINLNKTRIAMEQEKHAKQMADIAAEKKAEEDSIVFLMNLNKTRIAMEQEKHAKQLADIAAEKKAEEDSMIFLMNLNKTRIAMEQEKHAKQMADIAAEKKAEEDSLIFLMQLRKQIQIDEEQAHAKKMAAVAAEKKANESLGLSNYIAPAANRPKAEFQNIDLITGKLAEQKTEVSTLQQLVGTVQASFANASNASASNIDFVTGKLIKQQQEVITLEQAISRLSNTSSNTKAVYSGIDPATGMQVQQKKEVLNIDEAISKLENEHQADIRRHAEENAAREKQRSQDAKAFHEQELNARKAQLKQEFDMRRAQQESRREKIRAKVESDMGKVRSMLDQLTTAQQRYNEQIELVNRMYRQERISLEQKSDLLKKIKKDLDDANAAQNKKSGLAGFLNRGAVGIAGGMLAGFGTAAIGSKVSDFLSSSVNIAVERQRVDMMLDALTSGTSSVGSLTGAIRELDKQSMLSYMEISKAAQTMLGFGVANELVMPSLNALSEISMGNAERFQSLSLAFGQVAASGKLAGQEILQMVNAGFNPLQEISRTTGRSMSDLRAAVSNGEISFSQVADAIISATEAGGRFYQMNETMMSTLGGRIAKFRSDLQIMQAELGQDLFPTIETILDMITGSKDQTKEFFNSFVMFSDAVGFFISGVSDLLAWMPKESGGGQKGAELMLKHVEKMKAAADSLEKAGDVEKAKTVREDAARIEQRISGGIREEMMQSEIDKFFQRLKDREQNRKEEEEKRKKEAEFQAELKRDPEKAKLWREELDNKMTLERLNKDTSKIAKEIEEERKNALMTEREILIENLGLANKVFDQDQRNLALKVLADFDASQIRKQREEDQNKLIKLLEDSKTAAEKLQEQINFVNEAQKNGLISAIDAKKILDKLNDDANKKDSDEQERRRKQLQEFSRSIDKRADAIERVKDIILAVKEGFLDQQTANREAMEIARGLVSDADKVAMDNPRMMDLGQAKLASQKLAKQLQNEQKVIDKLTELNALATQLVQQNNNAPRLMKK